MTVRIPIVVAVGVMVVVSMAACSASAPTPPAPARSIPAPAPVPSGTVLEWLGHPCPSLGQRARTLAGGAIVCVQGRSDIVPEWHVSLEGTR